MKKEILFRGKTINGNWVYGDLIQIGGGTLIYHGSKQTVEEISQEDSPCAVGFYPNEIAPVITETVGQFTGLTDKNGVKVFEGDIIESDGTIFKLRDFDDLIEFYYWHRECVILEEYTTIIGNIHDI